MGWWGGGHFSLQHPQSTRMSKSGVQYGDGDRSVRTGGKAGVSVFRTIGKRGSHLVAEKENRIRRHPICRCRHHKALGEIPTDRAGPSSDSCFNSNAPMVSVHGAPSEIPADIDAGKVVDSPCYESQ